MDELTRAIDEIATEHRFAGVVRIDRGEEVIVERAYGLANRATRTPNAVETRIGIASGTKGFTAVTITSLIHDDLLELTTTARSVLGDDLRLVAGDVTVEHLLAHRSGIGDYADEDGDVDVLEYGLEVPVQELATTEQYVRVLDGYATKFDAGTAFSYCNAGYVVLALIAERVTGVAFADLVRARVCVPSGMVDTEFLRSDELPERAAIGYLDATGSRTNVFHLPVVGSGDGGIYTTVSDIARFWRAFFAGRIVPANWVAELVEPRSDVPERPMRYGLGFWLHPTSRMVQLEGMDAGASFRSVHDPRAALTHTVMSNTTDGAWPITRFLDNELGTAP